MQRDKVLDGEGVLNASIHKRPSLEGKEKRPSSDGARQTRDRCPTRRRTPLTEAGGGGAAAPPAGGGGGDEPVVAKGPVASVLAAARKAAADGGADAPAAAPATSSSLAQQAPPQTAEAAALPIIWEAKRTDADEARFLAGASKLLLADEVRSS